MKYTVCEHPKELSRGVPRKMGKMVPSLKKRFSPQVHLSPKVELDISTSLEIVQC
jgi:hypothetical protein